MISSVNPTTRDYISYSAIRTFQGCPLKYRFRYIDGLTEDCVSSSLVFGSAIHAALEHYFYKKLAGETLPGLEDLLEVYQEYWQSRSQEEIRFGKTESAASLQDLAKRMLQSFLDSDLADPDGQIIGVEEELRGAILPETPDLLGRVDLLLETEDAVIVQDFKTSRTKWSNQQAEDQSEQLLLYADLASRLVPGKKLRIQFAVISKTKVPSVQVLESEFDAQRLSRTKDVIGSVWSAINAGNFYPAPSPIQCTGCGFRNQCSQWQGSP